jgi:hypothetical protein
MAPFTKAAHKAVPARTIRAVSRSGISSFCYYRRDGFKELAFNVFIPAAVLLTGFLGLFLMMRL